MEADFREREHDDPRSSSKSSVPLRERPTLLRLPLELREMIYQHLLLVGVVRIAPVVWDKKTSSSFWSSKTTKPRQCRRSVFRTEHGSDEGTYGRVHHQISGRPSLAILGTCCEIYRDTAPYFYSKNTFSFDKIDENDPSSQLYSPITTALTFLEDRPSCALEWIKHIKIRLGTGNLRFDSEIPIDFLHQGASIECVERFYTILRDRLKLKQLSILVRGWPLDVRLGRLGFECRPVPQYRPDYRGWNRKQENVDPWDSKHARTGLKQLLSICNLPRLSVEIHAERPFINATSDTESFDPGRLVAFAALLRPRLLKGGKTLGTGNISVHKRHSAMVIYPVDMPQDLVCRRRSERVFVVRCDDDHSGKSLLRPTGRLPRLSDGGLEQFESFFRCGSGLRAYRDMAFEFPFESPGWSHIFKRNNSDNFGWPFVRYDYKNSDDGENDSLKDVELGAEDVEHLPPEAFM